MPKFTDQDFDNLFRQAADRLSPEHRTGDWDDMQRRLEAAERDARARNISLYSIVALLLLYSLLMPENLKFGSYRHASVMSAMEQGELQPLLPVDETGAVDETDAIEQSSIKSATLTEPISNEDARSSRGSLVTPDQEIKGARASSAAGNGQESGRLIPARDGQDEVGGSTGSGRGGQPSTLSRKRPLAGTMSVASAGLAANQVPLTAELANSGGDNRVVFHSRTGESFKPEPLEVPSTDPLFAEPETPGFIPTSVRGRVTHVQASVRHPWFVKLAMSPDFSSIDYGSAGKTGVNIGPLVEYSISPRFSVSTGAIWSKKLYDQKDPDKSYGPGGYPVHANMLNGDCRILDIPINVTYYMFPARRTNVFVTVGSSSYIMLDEEYIYTVTRNNHDYEYVENYSNKNNEWFSMLNLSVGVQRQVGKRWFVQGEPFLKAPMKGIGEGKVNLVSAGVFVSVKYWINQSR